MNAVLIVLPDGRRCPELLRALRDAGAHSATIVDNEGLDFVLWRGLRASMARHWDQAGGTGKTVLAVVPDVLTDSVIAEAEHVLAGAAGATAGMILAWGLAHFGCYQGDQAARGEGRAGRQSSLTGGRA
jgi:hypothetical protein